MCGIAGWFAPDPSGEGGDAVLQRMIERLRHRGPDGDGILVDGHAALAHCRLAIIDLETGQQPMTIQNGDLAIVYNGEIYNYRELRRELAAAGSRFRTGSDTEVILETYRVRGSEGFSRLRGMFAFALWDRRRRRALLVRDGIGIKPLFYYLAPNRELVFASEAKAILEKIPGLARLDSNALHLLLNFRYLPGELSLFQGIRQLAPGHILSWEPAGETEIQRLVPAWGSPPDGPLEALGDSVRAHLTADVEVGAYLSGGIDSAAVTALARRTRDIRTFTLDIGDDPREAANAAATARLLGVTNECSAPLAESVDHMLPALVWHLEVPKINAFQTCEIARFAAARVKVVLSGLGGDELFFGYNLHHWLYRARQIDRCLPRSGGRLLSGTGLAALKLLPMPLWSEPERALKLAGRLGEWPAVYGLLRNVWDDPGLRRAIYGPRMLDGELDDAHETLAGLWNDTGDPVGDAADFEWRQKMVNDLLWQEDRSSMAFGLEVRVPFLDQSLKRSVDAIGIAGLMPGGEKKGYMKTMLREVLPAEIFRRPKSGFQVNAPVFFRSHLENLARHWLSRNRVVEYGLFNPDFVARILRYGTARRYRWHYFMLYFMLMTHMWIEIFEQGGMTDLTMQRMDGNG